MGAASEYLKKQAIERETNKILKGAKPTPIATTKGDGLYIPNHSGQHDAGTTKTPVSDLDIANKAYVDAAGGVDWEADQSPKVINAANYVDNDTTYAAGDFAHDSLASIPANDHIDWTNATDNFSTTGTIHSNGNITTDGSVDGQDIAGMAGFVTSNSTHRGDASGADHSDIVTAVGLNTSKNTNVSTDLSAGTRAPTTIDVNSSDGSNATLVEADTTNAGILGSDKWDEIVANSLKDTDVDHNVTTNITIVEAPTNVDVQSSDGSNDTIAAANVTNAGVMTTTMYDEHVVNTAHAIDNTQAHTDYLLNSGADVAVGPLTTTADNSTADQAFIPMILYNTDDTPPAASGFPVGTLYVQYTA